MYHGENMKTDIFKISGIPNLWGWVLQILPCHFTSPTKTDWERGWGKTWVHQCQTSKYLPNASNYSLCRNFYNVRFAKTRRMWLTDAELAANGVVQCRPCKSLTIAWCPCTPPANLETFSEKISASTGSGKEIASLKKKKMKNMILLLVCF